jgi:hypothetical protein
VTATTGSKKELPLWLVAAYLVVCIVVLYYSFALHPDCLFTGTDGNFIRIVLETEKSFRIPFSQFGASPVEGNFDAYLPLFNRDYLFAEVIGRVITSGTPSKAQIFTSCSVFLVCCGYLLARSVRTSRSVALTAGLLIPITIMPIFQGEPTMLDAPLFNINPYFSDAISYSLLTVAALWHLSARWSAANLAWLIAPLVCFSLAMVSQPPSTALMVLVALVYGTASLWDAKRWWENWLRFTSAALLLFGSLILGFITYQRGLITYTAYYYFSDEFVQTRSNLYFASILFQGRLGELIIGLAYLGAVYAALSPTSRLRKLAVVFLFANTAYLVTAYAVVRWATKYQGISPNYFETFFVPFYLLFGVVLIDGLLNRVAGWCSTKDGLALQVRQRIAWMLPLLVLGLIAAWNSVNASAEEPLHCRRGGVPIQATPITDRLAQDIASAPGREFRGLVAVFNGFRGQTSVAWDKNLLDANLWWEIGNDHRDVGLWKFGIPTLNQYSQFITPPYYLMLREFLSRPADLQTRSILVLTHPDERVLELFGVRFVIAYHYPGIGTPVLEMHVPTASELPAASQEILAASIARSPNSPTVQRLFMLGNTNLGDYSPTEIRKARDFASGLAIMHESGLDFRTTLVTDFDLPRSLVSATASRIILSKTGFVIKASSAGQSALVLPIQYSHCWRIGLPNVELFRADLTLLGVLFTGKIEGELTFEYGPLMAGGCRINDVDDMVRLKIDEAGNHGVDTQMTR